MPGSAFSASRIWRASKTVLLLTLISFALGTGKPRFLERSDFAFAALCTRGWNVFWIIGDGAGRRPNPCARRRLGANSGAYTARGSLRTPTPSASRRKSRKHGCAFGRRIPSPCARRPSHVRHLTSRHAGTAASRLTGSPHAIGADG